MGDNSVKVARESTLSWHDVYFNHILGPFYTMRLLFHASNLRTFTPSLFASAQPQTCFAGGSQFKGVMYMEVTTFGFIFIV